MCRWHTRPDYIYCGCSDIILTRQAFPHNIVQVHIQLCGRFQDYPSVADRLSPWLLILEAVQHQILNTEICKWTDPLCPPFPKCPKTIRPRQFRYLPFSFVTPHYGTQLFYGTQCHQGLPTAQCDSTSFFDPQLHALLLKHCAGLPAHLPAAPPPPCWPYYPFQKCCQRCEPPIIFPVPFYSLQVPWGWRLKSRQSLTCLLLLLSLADLIISLPFLQSRPQPLSVPIGPAVQAVGFLASLILSIAGRSRGQVSVEQAILASRWSPIYIRWRLAHNSFSGSPPASARLLHSHLPSSDPTLKVKKQSASHNFSARVRMDSSPLLHLSRTLPHCIDSLVLGGRAASLCRSCKYMHQSIFVNIICPHQGHNPDNPSPKHTASTPSRLWFGWSAFHSLHFANVLTFSIKKTVLVKSQGGLQKSKESTTKS